MNSRTKAIFLFLIALLVILAGSTSFFAAKTYKLSNTSNTPLKETSSASVGGDSTNTSKPSVATSSLVTRPAASTEKPSKPTDVYTVARGETLFAVAQANGSNWQDITEANGMTDADKIQAGKVLIIPKGGQVSFTIDNTLATTIQKDADGGKYQFRLDPVETARSDAPSAYGLKITDTFTLKNSDNGSAQVQATRDGKNFLIKLTQPITKGEKGIWAIESIKPV